MPVTIVWPHKLFRAKSEGWMINGASIESGRPMVGSTPQRAIWGGGGMVVAKLNDIHLRTREQIATWRAIDAQLDNGSNPIVVPCCDRRSSPLPFRATHQSVPHSDDTYFTDGTGYGGSIVSSTLTADASFLDTAIQFDLVGGRPLIAGEAFSIKHSIADWRFYRIASVEAATAITGGFHYSVTIRPPLRQDVSAGTHLEFDLPRCVMRTSEADTMDIEVDLKRFADPSVTFVEDFSALQDYA